MKGQYTPFWRFRTYYGTAGTCRNGTRYRYYRCRRCRRTVHAEGIEDEVAKTALGALKDKKTRERIATTVFSPELEEDAAPARVEALHSELHEIK